MTYKLMYYPETRLSAEYWVVVQWNDKEACWDSVLGLEPAQRRGIPQDTRAL